MGNSKRPLAASAVCATIFGINRMSRTAVSSTVYLRHAPERKKKTMFERSSAARSCRSRPDVQVSCDDGPSAFAIERRHPIDISHIRRKLVA
jgi:hypothetical protein